MINSRLEKFLVRTVALSAIALAGGYSSSAQADPALSNYGLYLGAFGLYGDGFVDGTATPAVAASPLVEQSPSGFGFGVTVGYDYLMHDTWLFGVVGDYAWLGGEDSNADGTRIWSMDDNATIRAKFGLAMDPRIAVYLTTGVAFTNASFDGGGDSVDASLSGWVLGGGIDIHLSRRWSMNVEYQHQEFDEWTFDAGGDTYDVGLQSEILKVGVRVPLDNWFGTHHSPLK